MADKPATASPAKFIFTTKRSQVTWPCPISVPKDNGEREIQIITAVFNVIPSDEIDRLSVELGDVGALDKMIERFVDLKDDNGAEVPTDTAKALLFQMAYVVSGFIDAYFEMAGGRLRKNSKTPRV